MRPLRIAPNRSPTAQAERLRYKSSRRSVSLGASEGTSIVGGWLTCRRFQTIVPVSPYPSRPRAGSAHVGRWLGRGTGGYPQAKAPICGDAVHATQSPKWSCGGPSTDSGSDTDSTRGWPETALRTSFYRGGGWLFSWTAASGTVARSTHPRGSRAPMPRGGRPSWPPTAPGMSATTLCCWRRDGAFSASGSARSRRMCTTLHKGWLQKHELQNRLKVTVSRASSCRGSLRRNDTTVAVGTSHRTVHHPAGSSQPTGDGVRPSASVPRRPHRSAGRSRRGPR